MIFIEDFAEIYFAFFCLHVHVVHIPKAKTSTKKCNGDAIGMLMILMRQKVSLERIFGSFTNGIRSSYVPRPWATTSDAEKMFPTFLNHKTFYIVFNSPLLSIA